MMKRISLALLPAAMMMLAAPQADAQLVEEFYRGKTLRMLIGYGPGGGYDLYGRLAAEFLPRFIRGNPTIVPQNMPGGGSLVAAKYMYEAAPKDGTVFGSSRADIGARQHGQHHRQDRRHPVQDISAAWSPTSTRV